MYRTYTLCALVIGYGLTAVCLPRPDGSKQLTVAKLIALTLDDGPKPYVLLGTRSAKGETSQSLFALLDREGVKATFFVMGWRLSKNADDWCRRVEGGVCREAAEEEQRRGYEIENHTYGHGDFRLMAKRYGEAWVLDDIERASRAIQAIHRHEAGLRASSELANLAGPPGEDRGARIPGDDQVRGRACRAEGR